MRWKFPGNVELVARGYNHAVAKLAELKPSEVSSLERYRQVAARRLRDLYRIEIRTDSNKHFIQDLEGNGLISRL
jgi:hypothetical protein